MKFDSNKISFKLWMYFTIFSGVILILLWLLQIVFLGSFYKTMKKNDVAKLANTIIKEYDKNDFQLTIDEIAFKNSIYIYITDKEGNPLFSSNEHGFNEPVDRQIKLNEATTAPGIINNYNATTAVLQLVPREYNRFYNMISESKEDRIAYTVEQSRFQGETLIYGAKMENEYLFISTPLDPLNGATSIISTQLVYVTIISLVLSFIIAFFISRKLSKPIIKVTESASELGKGNYETKFEGGYYTEIDDLADTLNYTATELSKVESLRKELIANISHDLRTPLTLIKSYSEMIRDISGDNKEKREENLTVIIEETDRLNNLVNNILDLSILQSGNENIKFDNVNLSEVVAKVISRFKPLCEHEGYKINAKVDYDLYVSGNEIRLEQVLYNLIGNAINYIGEDKEITINLINLGSKVRFEVKDKGEGIPEDEIEYIWDRYYKAKQVHIREKTGGTGLGLSIVKNILELHKAEYGVESKIGEGSTFWFEINK